MPRYILMSCALSQKLPAASKLWHRLVIGFNVNDEIFGHGPLPSRGS